MDINLSYRVWWGPFLEAALSTCRTFLDPEMPDHGLVKLAGLHLALDSLASRISTLPALDSLGVAEAIERVSPGDFGAYPAESFSQLTSVPQPTVRRHLAQLAEQGHLIERRSGRSIEYSLSAFSPDSLKLGPIAFAFCRWLLFATGQQAGSFEDPSSARDWGGLVRHYLAAFLAFARSRRLQNGPHTHVSIQIALIAEAEARIVRNAWQEGPLLDQRFSAHPAATIRSLSQPFYLSVMADRAGMPTAEARHVINRMAKVDQSVTWLDTERFMVVPTSSRVQIDGMGQHRFFYTPEMELALRALDSRLEQYLQV